MPNNPVPTGKPYLYAFSTGRLVLTVCMVLALMVLSLMLGIRIEKYQRLTELAAYDSVGDVLPRALPTPVQAVPVPTTTGAEESKITPAPSKESKSQTESLSARSSPAAPKAKAARTKQASGPELVKTREKPKTKSRVDASAAKAKPEEPVPAPKRQIIQKQRYAVQISASKDKLTASSQADILKNKGFASYLEEINLAEKGRFFRVMVGPFASKAEAESVRNQLIKDSRFAASYIRQIQ